MQIYQKEQQEDFSAAEIEEAANAKPLNVVANNANAVFKTPESEKNEQKKHITER